MIIDTLQKFSNTQNYITNVNKMSKKYNIYIYP